jgi:hypothetical protein
MVSAADKPIPVLILDQSTQYHNWLMVTPILKKKLEARHQRIGRLSVNSASLGSKSPNSFSLSKVL